MKATKTKSGKYRVQVVAGYNEFGKRIVKSFTAEYEWQAIKMAEDYKKGVITDKKELTVYGAFNRYIESRSNILSPSTIKGYKTIRDSRLQAIKDIKINDLTVADVQMAVNLDAKRLSRKSIRSAIALLNSALDLQDVELKLNKVTLPMSPPKDKYIPQAELVLKAIVGTELELPCLLAMWLSLRVSEVRGLQFRDISADKKTISIRRARMEIDGRDVVRECNKTVKSTRVNILPAYLYELIKNVPHKSDDEFIVQMSYDVLRRRFKKLMTQNGLDITFHTLRHEFATTLNDLGIPPEYIQKLGGWSTDNIMKSVYTHTIINKELIYQNTIDQFFLNSIESIKQTCENVSDKKSDFLGNSSENNEI